MTGHSLGGALAQLAAFHPARQGYPIAQVITFGAPKFAYLGTAKRFNIQSSNLNQRDLEAITRNVVNKHDLVARVPPRWLGFQDVGRPIQNEKDGQWRFTDRVESLLPDIVFDSADLDVTPEPWVMQRNAAGRFVVPGVTNTTAIDDGQEFKKFRNRLYNLIPLLRAPVAYVLIVWYTIRAALDHPGRLYRGGFFEVSEPERYSPKPEPPPWTTCVILGLIAVVAAVGLVWLFYLIVGVLIESILRANATR